MDGWRRSQRRAKKKIEKTSQHLSSHSSQSEGRLVLRVTRGSGGRGLAFLVEFQEAGFFYHHGDGAGVVVGIFRGGQSSFLRRFGRVAFPADYRVSTGFRRSSEFVTQFWLLCKKMMMTESLFSYWLFGVG